MKIIRDIVTGFSKCYGFVEFEKEKCALRARQDAHEDVIDERVVFVDWEILQITFRMGTQKIRLVSKVHEHNVGPKFSSPQ